MRQLTDRQPPGGRGARPPAAGSRLTVLGIHGMKRRWAAHTLRDGLHRDSAAWFVAPARTWAAHGDATLCAAVYLALSAGTRERLAERAVPGGYTALFRREPDLLPTLLLFADRPTGREILHRYAWLAPTSGDGRTAAYTKVARAGRRVPAGPDHLVVAVRLDEVAEVERRIERRQCPPGWWSDPGLVRRIEVTGYGPGQHRPASKIAEFCAGLAGRLRPGVAAMHAAITPHAGIDTRQGGR